MPIEPGTTVMFGSSEAAYPTLVTDPFSTPTHNARDTGNVSGARSGPTQTEVRLGITDSRNIAKRES